MNTTSTATCPSCHGTGGHHEVISSRYGTTRTVKCLSCYGTGEVESHRVCCQCGHWIAACTCRHANEPIVTRTASKRKQHTLYVAWMERAQCYVVRIQCALNVHREVARFEDEDNAYSFAREAEWAAETEWPELRERYGAKGKVKA